MVNVMLNEKATITVQKLLDAGYKQYKGVLDETLYQKPVRDEHGTRYHVTFRHGILPANPGIVGDTRRPYFAPTEQFTIGKMVFNVEVVRLEETIEEIEAFYADVWTKLGADYYQDNHGDRHVSQRTPPCSTR